MKLNQKLAVTTAGLALGLTAMEANPARAAVITVDFQVTETPAYGGPPILNQPLSGFYSFDDSTTPLSGATSEPKYPLTDFSFNFLGEQFTVSDLVQGAGYGGSATGLVEVGFKIENNVVRSQFVIANQNFGGSANRSPNIAGTVEYSQRTTTPVPEPATIGGWLLAGLFSIALKKKAASKKQ
ncbi:PEP-CTERM sorting domain-containing protein [Tolypothrix campylonemoides VB511288]|nr:PEP-CTERM sorting domain-containing protein [Tolypothrix campylonemoides VB511288]